MRALLICLAGCGVIERPVVAYPEGAALARSYAHTINLKAGVNALSIEPCDTFAARCVTVERTDPFVDDNAEMIAQDTVAETEMEPTRPTITFSSRALRRLNTATLHLAMLHELGHALGAGHQGGPENIMAHDLCTTLPLDVAIEQVAAIARSVK